jgi:CBS domain-containing protein
MPEKPAQELVVALAGPAVNILLALVLLPIVLGLGLAQGNSLSLSAWAQPGVLGLLTFLLSANLSLAVFNLIPAFPMDGGRVFRAVLGLLMNYQDATRIAVVVGRALALGLGLIGIFSGQFFLALIALFIFTASGQEGQAVVAKGILRNVRVGETLSHGTASLPPHATLSQVASTAMSGGRSDFAVMDPHSRQLLGIVSSGDIAQALASGQWQRRVTDIMRPVQNLPAVTPNTTLAEVQEKLAAASSRVATVYDGSLFRGLISLEDVSRVFHFLSRSGQAGQQRPAWAGSR